MAGVETRDFTAPDETRTPEKTTVEPVNLAGGQIGRYTFQPGWRWSECIKPVVGTDSCQVDHTGYVRGRGAARQARGRHRGRRRPRERLPHRPGHDAWVVGDEPVVLVEFQGAANYAKG